MKKNIFYTGNEIEALWGTLGYMGPMFIVTMNYDKTSPFLYVNGIRSAIIFILMCLINIPVILIKYNIVNIINPFRGLILFFGLILTIALFIDYCYATYQTANGYYKKTLFTDHVFGKLINSLMISTFLKK